VSNLSNKKLITSIGRELKKLRISQNISQYQLSYRADIPRSQIIRIENGEINTSISSIYAICKALDVTLSSVIISTENNL